MSFKFNLESLPPSFKFLVTNPSKSVLGEIIGLKALSNQSRTSLNSTISIFVFKKPPKTVLLDNVLLTRVLT